jgi:ABC-type antimicrobial peptide transport system permease subunit
MSALQSVNPAWRTTGRKPAAEQALIGIRAARQLHKYPGDHLTIVQDNRKGTFQIVGTVESGASEDDQVFITLQDAEALTGLRGLTTIQVRIDGGTSVLQSVSNRLAAALPDADVQPVRAIQQTEGRVVLSTTTMLIASILLILITIGLCVTAALASMALERQRDFGIMRALGAGERAIFGLFVGEGVLLGIIASIVGYLAGGIVAWRISRAVFGLSLYPDLRLFIATLAITIAITALSALAPLPLVRRATPATILKGE